MAIINAQQKWIYLMEPHTASRAVAKALMKRGGVGQLGHHHIGIPELTNRRRTQLIQRVEEYKIICTVRNPLDVLVTKWKYGPKDQPFADWVKAGIEAKSENVTTPMSGLWRGATHFVYYEHLEEDLKVVLGDDLELELDPAHVTLGKKPWESYYEDPVARLLHLEPGEEHLCSEAYPPPLLDQITHFYQGFMAEFGYSLYWETDGSFVCLLSEEIGDQKCRKL